MSFAIVVLIGAAAWTHQEQFIYVACLVLGMVGCLLLLKLCWRLLIRRYKTLKGIDVMNGLDFEHYVANLLRDNGFHSVRMTEKYDLGVDIIAEKNGIRWGIQAKRYSGLVKADAVRQAVTGLRLYDCDRAMVITNSTYSIVAQRLAAGNDCVLIDRRGLSQLNTNSGVIL